MIAQNMALARARARAECLIEAGLVPQIIVLDAPGKAKKKYWVDVPFLK